MNCQEAVMLSLILSKKISFLEVRKAYQKQFIAKDDITMNPLDKLLNLEQSKFFEDHQKTHGEIKPGNILFFGGNRHLGLTESFHVAICVQKNGRNPILMSLWNLPRPTMVQVTLTELLNAIKAAKKDTGKVTLQRLCFNSTITPKEASRLMNYLFEKDLINRDGSVNYDLSNIRPEFFKIGRAHV